jgi:hypothetical protein
MQTILQSSTDAELRTQQLSHRHRQQQEFWN